MMTRREYAVAKIMAIRWNARTLCQMQAKAISDLHLGKGDRAILIDAIKRYDAAIAIRAIDGGGRGGSNTNNQT